MGGWWIPFRGPRIHLTISMDWGVLFLLPLTFSFCYSWLQFFPLSLFLCCIIAMSLTNCLDERKRSTGLRWSDGGKGDLRSCPKMCVNKCVLKIPLGSWVMVIYRGTQEATPVAPNNLRRWSPQQLGYSLLPSLQHNICTKLLANNFQLSAQSR